MTHLIWQTVSTTLPDRFE